MIIFIKINILSTQIMMKHIPQDMRYNRSKYIFQILN